MRAFDPSGPLPEGTLVLEASAGTGKTWAIAALASRFIAEGRVTLDQLMMVTFSRAATHEMRGRIRERLVRTERALGRTLDGEPPEPDDAVLAAICSGDRAEIARRHERIARALSEFDAATIATTHEFCQKMLAGLGVLADTDATATLVEDLDDLTREAAVDEYLRRYAAEPEVPFSLEVAIRFCLEVVRHATARIEPADAQGTIAERVAFAEAVRAAVERRKRQLHLYTFDDLMARLDEAISDPVHGPAALARLRERYHVVLIDEFQDTDPQQWRIVKTAFHRHATLVLIGDPKQAIYAFRGADVYSYLAATAEADAVATLATNWRTDSDLVTALFDLLGDAALGDDRIVVRHVEAHHPRSRIRADVGRQPLAPLRLRVLAPEPDKARRPRIRALRETIEDDVVTDIAALLGSGAELRLRGEDWHTVHAGDIAILVRTNERGERLRARLGEAGVPAVWAGANSVFSSPSAQAWSTLLAALEDPRSARVRAAVLTPLIGWSLADLAAADDDTIGRASQLVKSWRRVLADHGMAGLQAAVESDRTLFPRLLAERGGERELTDLRHVAEALHAAQLTHGLAPFALRSWLRDRMEEARSTGGDRSRRLETDQDAVQIMTIHGSKGLEFPIVYLPDTWDQWTRDDEGQVITVHAGDTEERVVDVGGLRGEGRPQRYRQHLREQADDSLRQLYVGLTRAQCQVVAWWASNASNTASAPLHRILFRDRGTGGQPVAEHDYLADPRMLEWLGGTAIAVETVSGRGRPALTGVAGGSVPLGVRTFDRAVDLEWRRTSYSGLTAAAHGFGPVHQVGSEQVETPVDDEQTGDEAAATGSPATTLAVAAALTGDLARPSPMSGLPGGTAFGSLVHAIAEYVDPHAGDLRAAVLTETRDQLSRQPVTGFTADELTDALVPALTTPLGLLAGQRRLCDFAVADRLPELDFELPLVGGNAPRGRVRLADMADLIEQHLAPDDVLAGYPAMLRDPVLAEEVLRGYLTGSIDAVLRYRTDDTPRYLVVDYKTNHLGIPDEPLLLGHYTRPAMAQAMMRSHYPLQALLYAVALHRFLRWRQPGYEPGVHLGGVLYLFVRGMAGPDTPESDGHRTGVFDWTPPPALVVALSDLLTAGAATAATTTEVTP